MKAVDIPTVGRTEPQLQDDTVSDWEVLRLFAAKVIIFRSSVIYI